MLNVFQLAKDITYFKKTIDRLEKKQIAIDKQLATVIEQQKKILEKIPFK